MHIRSSRTGAVSTVLAAALLAVVVVPVHAATKKPATTKRAATTKKAASKTSTTVAAKATTSAPAGAAADTTGKVVAAADAFVATLDATSKSKLIFANDAKKSDWSNLPDGLFKRDGLRLADMTAAQQTAAWNVLQALLSADGYQKVRNITIGDGELAKEAGSNNRLDFGADHYWFRFLGTPSTSRWILQFGGHHLALNATFVGNWITLGPTLLAAQPSEFTSNGVQVRPLKAETDLAYTAVNLLTDAQKAKAVTAGVGDLVLGAGADGKSVAGEGISLSELSDSQRSAVRAVIASWINTLGGANAATKLAEVDATLGETKFLWGGSTTLGQPAYYRIQGPKVYIEFSHQVGGGANAGGWTHIHAIYRDPSNDYGAAFAA